MLPSGVTFVRYQLATHLENHLMGDHRGPQQGIESLDLSGAHLHCAAAKLAANARSNNSLLAN